MGKMERIGQHTAATDQDLNQLADFRNCQKREEGTIGPMKVAEHAA